MAGCVCVFTWAAVTEHHAGQSGGGRFGIRVPAESAPSEAGLDSAPGAAPQPADSPAALNTWPRPRVRPLSKGASRPGIGPRMTSLSLASSF